MGEETGWEAGASLDSTAAQEFTDLAYWDSPLVGGLKGAKVTQCRWLANLFPISDSSFEFPNRMQIPDVQGKQLVRK